VVPRELAAAIVSGAQAKVDAEAERMKAIARGDVAQAWVEDSLRSFGVLGKDEKL
jgi:regulator of RNase E activity RraA